MADGTSSTKHTIKNATIGVITTVIGAIIIYFLIGNPKKAEFAKKKDATQKAWTSFKENKTVFSTVMKQIDSALDMDAGRKTLNHQIDIAINNLENIKKESDADQRVFSTVDITIEQIKEMKPIFNTYFDNRIAYIEKNPDATEDAPYLVEIQQKLINEMRNLGTRDTLRLSTFYRGLVKDYDIQ